MTFPRFCFVARSVINLTFEGRSLMIDRKRRYLAIVWGNYGYLLLLCAGEEKQLVDLKK